MYSIVYEVIRTISKNVNQKHKPNQNQLTKQKQANKKQQRQQVFARTKTSKSLKVVCFAFWCFVTLKVFSQKKKKKKLALNCPDNLIYYTTDV